MKNMKYLFFCFIVLFSLIYSPNLFSQENKLKILDTQIEAMVPEGVNDTTPGLVLGIVQNGELIYTKAFGLANISYGIPNDEKLVYNSGSVSKQFLGYAFAMLHVNGELHLDDPVNKYLEDWPEFEHKVSLRHLLTHTSGYREAYTMSSLAGRTVGVDRLSKEECLNVVRKQPALEFIPGSRYTYNSTAWVILAEILEKITGQDAAQWVTENILLPLEMHDTQIERYVGEVIMNAAESYRYNPEMGFANPKSNRAIFGAADIYSSIEDMAKWINNFKTAQIGGKEVHEVFFDPYILSDGTNAEYGLGIAVDEYRGLKRYRHTGGHEAFATQLSYYPDHDLGIITFSNYGGTGWIPTSEIAELFLQEFMKQEEELMFEFPMTKAELEKFAGLYISSKNNGSLTLEMKEDSLTYQGRERLVPSTPNTFKIEGWSGSITIDHLEEGEVLLTMDDGTKNYYRKDMQWMPAENELLEYESDYRSQELETVYHLAVKEEKLVMEHRWNGTISLEAVAKDFFRSNRGFHVKFNRNAEGTVESFAVYSGRTLNVVFELVK